MTKIKLTSAATLLAITCSASHPAHSTDGVHFNGSNYLSITNLDTGSPDDASAGVCSYWFASSRPTQATIVSSYPDGIFGSPQPGILIEHYPVGTNMIVHVFVEDVTADSYMNYYTATPLHYYSGTQQAIDDTYVMVYWDTATNKIAFNIDGIPGAIDTTRSFTFGGPFRFPGNHQMWSMGAKLVPGSVKGTLVPSQYLTGDVKQLWCHAGDDDYNILSTPGGFPIGPTTLVLTPSGVFGPAPNPLGIDCEAVFLGTSMQDELPMLCMTGDHIHFPQNAGYPFAVIPNGSLTDAAYNVFELWKNIP